MPTSSLHDFTDSSNPSSTASVNTMGGTSKTTVMPSDEQASEPQHSAATAVFETNELLHHILLQLPFEFRVRVRRISKIWNHVISKLGYHVDPIAIYHDEYVQSAMHAPGADIRLNPILKGEIITIYNWPITNDTQTASVPDRSTYSANLREFLTVPPITEVMFYYRFHGYSAVMQKRDGVRVGDMVETLDRMRSCAVERVPQDEASPSGPGAEPVASYRICDESYNNYFTMISDELESSDGSIGGQRSPSDRPGDVSEM
jgi:hypothetical protein